MQIQIAITDFIPNVAASPRVMLRHDRATEYPKDELIGIRCMYGRARLLPVNQTLARAELRYNWLREGADLPRKLHGSTHDVPRDCNLTKPRRRSLPPLAFTLFLSFFLRLCSILSSIQRLGAIRIGASIIDGNTSNRERRPFTISRRATRLLS